MKGLNLHGKKWMATTVVLMDDEDAMQKYYAVNGVVCQCRYKLLLIYKFKINIV